MLRRHIKGLGHWVWITILVQCRSAFLANGIILLRGRLRWFFFRRRRRHFERLYEGLARTARAAGLTGKLTETSPRVLTRDLFYQRGFLGCMPALIASSSLPYSSSLISFPQADKLRSHAESGKGVVIAGTHFGSMGLITSLLTRHGFPSTIIRDGQFDDFLGTMHAQQFFFNAKPLFLYGDRPASLNSALMRCSRVLRKGEIVSYTADAGHGARSRQSTLFGHPITLRTALIELGMKCGSSIVSGFSYVENGKVCIELVGPDLLTTDKDLDDWCHKVCLLWQQMLLDHPEAIAWHTSDLLLISPKELAVEHGS